MAHPQVAGRPCESCRKYVYDQDGRIERRPRGIGLPILRPKGSSPPCSECPKIPPGLDGIWWNAVDFSPRNQRCWEHYQECKAVGRWPDDPVVKHHAALIRRIEDRIARRHEDSAVTLIGSLLLGGHRR